MSEELEALELLKVYELTYPKVVEKPFKVYPINPNINREKTTIGEVFKDKIPLIEKALKDKEKQDHYIETLEDRLNNAETTYERYKRALNVIRKKGILVNGLIQSKDLEEYNILCLNHGMTELPTQEEYDLLKEVL